jgi:hypothetical protein
MLIKNFLQFIFEKVDIITPIIAYHGSRVKFDTFSEYYMGQTDAGYYGRGFYFTNDKEYASEFCGYLYEVKLNINKPFILPNDSTSDSPVMFEARDKLVEVYPEAEHLKTIRTIPSGYHLVKTEDNLYCVYPNEELYNTDAEIYGEDGRTELEAIIIFNDILNGVDWELGWVTSILKNLGRDEFTDRLNKLGYDILIIEDNKHDTLEYVMWDKSKIKILNILEN